MTKEQYLNSPKSKRFQYLFMRHPLTILFGYVFVFVYGMALYPFFNSPKKHYDCMMAFLMHIAAGIALVYIFGWLALVLVLIIPRLHRLRHRELSLLCPA